MQEHHIHVKRPLNYFYFAPMLTILIMVHTLHIFFLKDFTIPGKLLTLFNIALQCFIEVTFLALIAHLLRRHRIFKTLFVISTFFIFTCQLIDFPMTRFMGVSIWEMVGLMMQESADNYIKIIHSSNVPFSTWMMTIGALISGILSSVVFYKLTDKISGKRPLHITTATVGGIFLTSFAGLVIVNVMQKQWFSTQELQAVERILPFKSSFFPNYYSTMQIKSPMKKPDSEADFYAKAGKIHTKMKKKPNIYLFIAESLREDFIKEEWAPNLSAFKEKNIHFPLAYSCANGTHCSWFSYFYSKHSLYWGAISPKTWQRGSPALNLLQEQGYKVHVFSATSLEYYDMDKIVFGNDVTMPSTYFVADQSEGIPVHARDSSAVEELIKTMDSHKGSEGNVYITFLDSTHFGYSFPDSENDPLAESQALNFFKAIMFDEGLEGVKDRYKKALHFIDSLFGKFQTKAKSLPTWEDSIVVFCGDHAEEFKEQGHLFHASSLTREQINIPLYFKMGKNKEKVKAKIASQLDVFPTIFHHLTKTQDYSPLFQGKSLYTNGNHYAISARVNMSLPPYEFSVQNEKERVIVRFSDEKNIFGTRLLKILSVRDEMDNILPYSPQQIQEHFKEPIEQFLLAP